MLSAEPFMGILYKGFDLDMLLKPSVYLLQRQLSQNSEKSTKFFSKM